MNKDIITGNSISKAMMSERTQETIYFSAIMINTKAKVLPKYMLHFFEQLSSDSNGIFDCRKVFVRKDDTEYWISTGVVDGVSNGDNLYQFDCTLNIPNLNAADFNSYMDQFIVEDIAPFLTGAGFELAGFLTRYETPRNCVNIGDVSGGRTLVLKDAELSNISYAILLDVFRLDESDLPEVDKLMRILGFYRLEGVITKENKERITNLLDLVGVNYIIE